MIFTGQPYTRFVLSVLNGLGMSTENADTDQRRDDTPYESATWMGDSVHVRWTDGDTTVIPATNIDRFTVIRDKT